MGKASRKRRERMEQVQQAREIEGLVKRARLWDRVKRSKTVNLNNAHAMVVDISSIVVDLTNTQPKIHPTLWGMPFPHVFVEFTTDGVSFGVLLERINKGESSYSGIMDIYPAFKELESLPDFLIATVVFVGNGYGSDVMASGFAFVLSDGRSNYWSQLWKQFTHLPITDGLRETSRFAGQAALYTLNLMNARNIATVDHEPDPADNAAYQRHFGVPMTTYKTLAIKPMGKRYERDGEQQQFDVMPLHIRRGNFAHYTEDAPLFGKYTGTFWRPATAVGDAKNGIRVKDYEVKP